MTPFEKNVPPVVLAIVDRKSASLHLSMLSATDGPRRGVGSMFKHGHTKPQRSIALPFVTLSRRVARRIRRSLPGGLGDWTMQEPKPPKTQPGWVNAPPDFIGVGAQKAGTTWWFYLLVEHPDVYQDPDQRPELHFFDRLTDTWPTSAEIRRYHALFTRPPGKLAGEKTPEYMYCYWVPAMLKAAAPDAKIIALLRDPVERYRSAQHRLSNRRLRQDRELEMAAFEMGLYADQVERLRAAYPADQILLLQYERCVKDPNTEIARTYEFLGLAPLTLTEEQLRAGRNVSRGDPPQIAAERLRLLRQLYEDDVRRVARLLPDLDLSLWPNFSNLD